MEANTGSQRSARRKRRITRGWVRAHLPLIIFTLLLIGAAIIYLLPLYWMFTGSLKVQKGIMQTPPEWLPAHPTLENWRNLFAIRTISPWTWFKNSVIVASGTVVISVSLSALAGYAFAKKQFPGRELLFFLILATMMLPAQVTLVPMYLFVRKVGFYNTYFGMILPMVLYPFGVFLMRQFMQAIPNELLDAAKIDGASEWGQFWRIAAAPVGARVERPDDPDLLQRVGQLHVAVAHGQGLHHDDTAGRSFLPGTGADRRACRA